MPRESLAEYVEEFRRYKRDLAFVDRKGYRTVRWTYPRIAETAAQVARELERVGVQKGDRVLIWGEDCGEWVATFYGCVLRGAVAVALDKIASPEFATANRPTGSGKRIFWIARTAETPRTCRGNHQDCFRRLSLNDWNPSFQFVSFSAVDPLRRARNSLHIRRNSRSKGSGDHARQRAFESRTTRKGNRPNI